MDDPRYLTSRDAAIRECGQNPPTGGDWRLYLGAWAAERAVTIPGDFVESGVDRGLLSRTIMEYINFNAVDKKFYLIDAFSEIGYDNSYENAKKVFAPFPNAIVIKGSVPEILGKVEIKKVAYLCIDMNSPEPEIAAANYFWDKMSPGAIILLDDYGIPGREPQRDAFDEWAAGKGVSVLSLPTTQGLVIKPQ